MRKVIALVALAAILAPVAFAAGVKVTVTQVKATGSGGEPEVDKRLSGIKEGLVKTFRYSKYAYISSKSSDISSGGTATYALADGNFLDVTHSATEGEGKSVVYVLNLSVYKKGPRGNEILMNTKLKRAKGAAFLLGLGASKKVGGTLILVIKAG